MPKLLGAQWPERRITVEPGLETGAQGGKKCPAIHGGAVAGLVIQHSAFRLPHFADSRLALRRIPVKIPVLMFSHVVIFWTNPDKPEAADAVVAGGNKYLKNIPGLLHFHIGKMAPSHRPVVDQSYQVALNIGFNSKHEEHAYQSHPQHLEFVEHCVKPFVKKVLVYDFE